MARRAKVFVHLGVVGTLAVAFISCRAGTASEPTAEQAAFFASKVRPVLEANCFQCHSHKGGKNKGHLMVDSLGALLKGGDSGPALVLGSPDTSLLLKAIGYADDELKMPPKGKLASDQIAQIRDWIKMGAPWPGSSSEKTVRSVGKITPEDRQWWAFQPLKSHSLPNVADVAWSKNPVDRFIHACALKKKASSRHPRPTRWH